MLSPGTGIFLQIPTESEERLLHPGSIEEIDDGVHTATLEDGIAPPPAGSEVLVYYEIRGRFSKQPVRVEAVLATEPNPVIGFRPVGDPMSAESRQSFRVSTLHHRMVAQVGSESSCPLLNVSATGFAIIAVSRFKVGQSLDVEIAYQGEVFTGRANLQSVRRLGAGRNRYGFHCLEDRLTDGDLQRGLQHMTASLQQEQLRRRSGRRQRARLRRSG